MRSERMPHKRGLTIVGLVIAAIILGTLPAVRPFLMINSSSATPQPIEDEQTITTGTLRKGTPDYATLLPGGTSIETLGGWTRVSPANRDPVYAYVDKIGDIPINVSQQPLPEDFKSQPDDQVRDLAFGYGASETLRIDSTTVYIGTSAKGPQSVIFTKNDLLVLIKASAAIPAAEWKLYVQSLN